MIYHTAEVSRELHDKFIAAHNGKRRWSTKALVRTVHEIEQHEVISSGIFTERFSDRNSWERTKRAITTLEDATEAYMVEVMAESNM